MKTFKEYLKEDTLVSQEELTNYYRYTLGSSSTTEDREAISDDTLKLIYKFLKQNVPNRYKVFIAYKKTHPQRQHIYGEKRYFILVDYNYLNPKKLPIDPPFPKFLDDLLNYLKPIIPIDEWDELRLNLITLENLASYSKIENNSNYYVWEPYNLSEPSKEMFGGMLKSL
jgi:hypothetical protein